MESEFVSCCAGVAESGGAGSGLVGAAADGPTQRVVMLYVFARELRATQRTARRRARVTCGKNTSTSSL